MVAQSIPTLIPSLDLAAALRWLPVPYHRPTGAVCPACRAADRLMHSISHRYLACLNCGWQRHLGETAPPDRAALSEHLSANLAGATGSAQLWEKLLTELDARAPDMLPPVAALLWDQVGPDTWTGPSRTTPGRFYQVRRQGHLITCTCPHQGARCWHLIRAAELGCTDTDAMRDLWPD